MPELTEHSLNTLRHSTAHVLAQAVLKLYPNAKLGIGPAIENGFYYDFDLPDTLTENDLEKIEKEMEMIIKEKQTFTSYTLSKKDTIEKLSKTKQEYKR